MGQPYVDYPGTNGRYASMSPVNLLDADTAHLQQSIGQWENHTNAANIALSALVTPQFGTNLLRWTSGSAALSGVRSAGNTTAAMPVSASTEYSFSVWVGSDDRTFTVQVREFDAGGATLATTILTTSQAATLPSGFAVTGTLTTHGSTATLHVQVLGDAGASIDEVMYADAVCIRAGDVATFVPSHMIVGKLDLRATLLLPSYAAEQAVIDTRSGNDGYQLMILNNGFLVRYGTGSADRGRTHGSVFTDGIGHDIRATFGNPAGWWEFFVDGDSVGDFNSSNTDPGTNPMLGVKVGHSIAGGAHLDGAVYSVAVRDGIGDSAPIVASFVARQALGAVS